MMSDLMTWTPWRFMLVAIAGWMNRQQQDVIEQYVEHYHLERPHRRLNNRRIVQPAEPAPTDGPGLCPEQLGGLQKSYHRQVA